MGVGINIKMERRPDVRAARQVRDVFISTHVISSEVERSAFLRPCGSKRSEIERPLGLSKSSLHALCLPPLRANPQLFCVYSSEMKH